MSTYIKWIIENTKLRLKSPKLYQQKLNDENVEEEDEEVDSTVYYVIQSRIINNQDVETNLEIILKLTTFAGDKVYSVICKNRNLLIKMDKLQ